MRIHFLRLSLFLALLSAPTLAEEGCGCGADEREEGGPPPDGAALMVKLNEAVKAKDEDTIRGLLKPAQEYAKVSKEPALVDELAGGFAKAIKLKNQDLKLGILETLGELRSGKGVKALKKYAFMKKTKKETEVALKVKALEAIGKLANPKLLEGIADQGKARELEVAEAAYKTLNHYAASKGKVRKKVAQFVMKRLSAEYPATGQSGGSVSEEARQRWQKVSPILMGVMQSVCRERTIDKIEDWQAWWKEYGKRKGGPWKDEKGDKDA